MVDGAWRPYSRDAAAEAALKLTAQNTAGLAPEDILTLASLPPDPAFHAARAGREARWKTEGGWIIGQGATSSSNGPSAQP